MFHDVKRNSRWLFAMLLVLALAIPAFSVLASPAGLPATQAEVAAEALTWRQVHQAPAGQYMYTLYFPTRDVGYAVSGPDWNGDTSAPTYITKTTDGGKTWKSTAIPNTAGWMRGLTCTDANNCWISGMLEGKRIMRTTDGGANWIPYSNQSGYPKWLWSAGWTGNGTTILAGTTCYDPNPDERATANWLRSTDGQIFKGVVARPGVMTCFVQWDIECPAPGVCYSAGKGFTWRTNDDGVKWTGQTMEGGTRQYGLSCTSASTCWVVGKSPWIRSTSNSGAGWVANAVAGLPTYGQFWDVAMVDNRTGYAVGCDNVATDSTDRCLGKGVIYKTTDGLSWLPIASPTTADIMDVWTFGEGSVFIADWSGKIWYGSTAPTATPTATPTEIPTATPTPSTGAISGIVFQDSNDDAYLEAGEPGLANAVMVLGRGGEEIATASSDSTGAFRFVDVAPGQYTLRQKEAPPGFERSLFLVAFDISANREYTFYAAHAVAEDDTPTPTPTVTVTPIPSETPTSGGENPETGWLPLLVR